MPHWYALDNAAKLFPAVSNRKNTSVFRTAAVLHEEINGHLLQRAVDEIHGRFPTLFVRLHSGVFWNYLEERDYTFRVQKETDYPCSQIRPYENNGYLLRILYANKRISLEFFHTLTDGSGAFEFMKSLLYYYLTLTGKEIASESGVRLSGIGASIDEVDDSYQSYYKRMASEPHPQHNAYRIRGTQFQQYGTHVTTGIMSARSLKSLATSHGATITALLSAVLITAILDAKPRTRQDERPVRITIPVNLRKRFPSQTLRNFFCVVNLTHSQETDARLPELLTEMSTQLKTLTTKENLQTVIAQNLSLERNLASRFVPLHVKKLFIALGFDLLGEKQKTITLTNLGNIPIPHDMSPFVDRFETLVYTTKRNPLVCAVCSVDDKLTISFSRTIMEPTIIRNFFRLLANEGIDITVNSNNWEDEA
jgi:NRPS condensation-like uncharacterized protein